MPLFPKIGSLESIVLHKLIINGEKGVTYLDFPVESELHNDDVLRKTMDNLRYGMFESEDDANLKADS